jgi:hypothetical protein
MLFHYSASESAERAHAARPKTQQNGQAGSGTAYEWYAVCCELMPGTATLQLGDCARSGCGQTARVYFTQHYFTSLVCCNRLL